VHYGKRYKRQAEGIAAVKSVGVKFGRPRKEIDTRFIVMYQERKAGSITAVVVILALEITQYVL